MQSESPAPEIQLESTQGGVASLKDFQGDIVVIYFGYTHCPDVCPTTLSTLNKALERMGSGADDVTVVMVTVDPARDDVASLTEYLGFFNSNFVGLTGDDDDVASVATAYGVFFEIDPGGTADEYTVSHTASLRVIDRLGHLRLVLPPDLDAEEIAADLEYLR